MREPRDVIARALESYMWRNEGEFSALYIAQHASDAILAALHEAGYVVVKRQVIDADALALGTITPNVDEDGLTTVYLINNTPDETS